MKAKLIKTDTNNFVLQTNEGIISGTLEPTKFEYKLSLKNCQAIENGYDLDEFADEHYDIHIKRGHAEEDSLQRKIDFILGFQKAIEILGDKKFSEGDVMLGWDAGVMSKSIIDNNWLGPIKQEKLKEHRDTYKENLKPTSLQQTEWDVIVEMEDVFIKNSDQYVDEVGVGNYSTHSKKPKIDSEGCLILKKI